ncbi:aminotransferase class I/II-fold pyridoxal phosphate-dependent enzyme [Acinetobacter sp.]|uniref:aminotransferase class I/II-fold pyridoxal phosphate-dependent enzyme n=1 Tax=Acinetobacter sp. TaxID=472 RepID=UPI0035B462AF
MNAILKKDSLNNPIDSTVGFARGKIIKSSIEEGQRLRHGQFIAAERVKNLGADSIGIFTGNQRDFLVREQDLATYCEEWVGPGLLAKKIKELAIEHMGGISTKHEVAIFNRTSAAIISVIASHAAGKAIVSIVPSNGRSHASVIRGARLGGVDVIEVQCLENWKDEILVNKPNLVVITTVTSSLEKMSDSVIREVADFAKQSGATVFLDEAYGARLRPVLHNGLKSLQFNVDAAVTNCDKAGLPGPRAGILVGSKSIIAAASAKGAEYGMEARAPILAGVMRSLEAYDSTHLIEEANAGKLLFVALQKRYGDIVQASDLGPMMHEDDVLRLMIESAKLNTSLLEIVPCEATAALGMVLLKDYGILTVNTHGQPGARVSLRFKPSGNAIQNVGGIDVIVKAIETSINKVAYLLNDINAMKNLILGEG